MKRNKPCPKCVEVGRDKDGDHLFLMKDDKAWHCARPYHEPYYESLDGEEIEWGKPDAGASVVGSVDIDTLKAESIRKIPKSIINKYGIRVEFDEHTREPVKHYYPITKNHGAKIIAWKIRTLPKSFVVLPPIGKTEVDLFGMQSYPFHPRVLIITAGELDACAATAMFSGFAKTMCVSLPFGDSDMKAIISNMEWLKTIDEIVFCPDQDEPGLAAVERIAALLPDIRIAKYSEKDACAMLDNGKGAEFVDAVEHAKKYKPSSIVTVESIKSEALKPIEWGLSYPFPRLTELTYGLTTKSIIGVGAGPGAGKTSFMKGLITHLAFGHGEKAGIFGLEETPAQILRSLGGYLVGLPVHLPDCEYDEEKLKEAIDSFDGKVYIYDHHGYRDWQDIVSAITYLAHDGVRFFFIDPLSALTAHLSASDANSYLNNAMFTLSKLTQQLDISVFHVNHLNNPATGKDHGAGGKVYASQFAGSRAMWKFSTEVWGLERNQLAEDDEEKNTVRLVLLKSRLSGLTGEMFLKYDRSTGTLMEKVHTGTFMDLVEDIK
jgi:twinkle protein